MTDEPIQNSALPEITGRWWPCVCGNEKHAIFLPADQVPAGRHGTYYDVAAGRQTVVTYWRIAIPRCAKALGTAPTAPVQKAPRKPAERPVEAVREAGAA